MTELSGRSRLLNLRISSMNISVIYPIYDPNKGESRLELVRIRLN